MATFSQINATYQWLGNGSTWTYNSNPTVLNNDKGRIRFPSLSNGNEITSLIISIYRDTSYAVSSSIDFYVTDDVNVLPSEITTQTSLGSFSIPRGAGRKNFTIPSAYLPIISGYMSDWYLLLDSVGTTFKFRGYESGSPEYCSGDHNDGTAWINDGGMWKAAVPWVNDGGIWRPSVAYINVSGSWMLGK